MLIYGRKSERGKTRQEALIPPADAQSLIMKTNASHEQACHQYKAKFVFTLTD